MQKDFEIWLGEILAERGWSIRELARRARLSPGSISNAMTGLRNPGASLCRKIAMALKLPEEEVFRHAGILPTITEDKERREQLIAYFEKLSLDMQIKAIAIVKSLADTQGV